MFIRNFSYEKRELLILYVSQIYSLKSIFDDRRKVTNDLNFAHCIKWSVFDDPLLHVDLIQILEEDSIKSKFSINIANLQCRQTGDEVEIHLGEQERQSETVDKIKK